MTPLECMAVARFVAEIDPDAAREIVMQVLRWVERGCPEASREAVRMAWHWESQVGDVREVCGAHGLALPWPPTDEYQFAHSSPPWLHDLAEQAFTYLKACKRAGSVAAAYFVTAGSVASDDAHGRGGWVLWAAPSNVPIVTRFVHERRGTLPAPVQVLDDGIPF